MAYTVTAPEIAGIQPIAVSDTVQNHPLGTVVRAKDPTYGEGEFVYLKGIASTAVGSLVVYDQFNATSTLTVATTHKLTGRPVAVSMSANVASQYGWYQTKGAAVVAKAAVKVNPNVAIFLSATAGALSPTAATGKQVIGAIAVPAATVASATGTVVVVLNEPSIEGQLT